jgi:hypothetical protein
MLKKDIAIDKVYVARISGRLVKVRLEEEVQRQGRNPYAPGRTHYRATNLDTGRDVTIKSAAKLRFEIVENWQAPGGWSKV